jgi:hypothetical protein
VGRCELNSTGSGYGPGASCCEAGNETSGSIKAEYFLSNCVTVSLSRTLLHGVKDLFHSSGVLDQQNSTSGSCEETYVALCMKL